MGQAAGAAVGSGVSMLDIAAGAGEQTRAIARCVGPGARVLTTDISSRILGQAADKLRRAGFAAVQTRVADAQALGLAGAGYDAAVSRLGLIIAQQLDRFTTAGAWVGPNELLQCSAARPGVEVCPFARDR